MKQAACIVAFVILFAGVAVPAQEPKTSADYCSRGNARFDKGDFNEAIKWENKALEFPAYAKGQGDKARQRLQSYREGRPWRETA